MASRGDECRLFPTIHHKSPKAALFIASIMSQTNSSKHITMTPYLHFTGGDHLYFRSWHPSSRGAIAGASVALLILAMSERLLHAIRGVMDARWKRSSLVLSSTRPTEDGALSRGKQETREENSRIENIGSTRVSREVKSRTIPPFVLSRDAARGALYSLQASLSYALMLAVMTFQAAYIISIIVGLGLGEVLFGRLASAHL